MSKASLIFLMFMLFSCRQNKTVNENSNSRKDYWFWTADWSSGEDLIAIGGTQDTLRIFSERKLEENYPMFGTITKVKWHPNKNLLAVSIQGEGVRSRIINLDDNSEIVLTDVMGSRAIGWNANGDLLAVGDNEGNLTIFDTQGKVIKSIELKQKAVTGLSWHPRENKVVTVGHHIAIYDLDDDTTIAILPRKEEVLMLCVAWHPSGDFFVTGDYGDYDFDYPALLQFWNDDGSKIQDIQRSKAEYRNLGWSTDGENLISASDAIRLWSKEGDLLKEKETKNLLWGIDWNKSNSRIVTTDGLGRVVIWNKKLEKIRQVKY